MKRMLTISICRVVGWMITHIDLFARNTTFCFYSHKQVIFSVAFFLFFYKNTPVYPCSVGSIVFSNIFSYKNITFLFNKIHDFNMSRNRAKICNMSNGSFHLQVKRGAHLCSIQRTAAHITAGVHLRLNASMSSRPDSATWDVSVYVHLQVVVAEEVFTMKTAGYNIVNRVG